MTAKKKNDDLTLAATRLLAHYKHDEAACDAFVLDATDGAALRLREIRKWTPEVAQMVIEAVAKLPPPVDETLATIVYENNLEHFKLAETLSALDQHGATIGLHVYGGHLVDPYVAPGRPLNLAELNVDTLKARFGQHIKFKKEVKGVLKQTVCPDRLAKAVFGSVHRLHRIEIGRISTTPIWRNNELHSTPGFNSELNVWVDCPTIKLPPICDRAAARSALKYLESWVCEFPFKSNLDHSVAIAAILSAAMRGSIGRCPGFIFTKPSHSAGATTMLKLMGIVLTGDVPSVMNAGRPQEEIDKWLDSEQRAGRPALMLDNIPNGMSFNSVSLAQITEVERRSFRILGETRSTVVENSQLVVLTGVNVKLKADLVRRFMASRIDPQMERPNTRKFKRPKMLEDAKRERSKILAAAFTIIAAYARSGERVETRQLNSFDEWSQTVAAALVWMGYPDPIQSGDALHQDDPGSETLGALLNAWRVLFGERQVRSAELISQGSAFAADSEQFDDLTLSPEDQEARRRARDDLQHRVLPEIATDQRGKVTALKLSHWLDKNLDGICGGFKLKKASKRSNGGDNVALWYIEKVDDAPAALHSNLLDAPPVVPEQARATESEDSHETVEAEDNPPSSTALGRLVDLELIDHEVAEVLQAAYIQTVESLTAIPEEELARIDGFNAPIARVMRAVARYVIAGDIGAARQVVEEACAAGESA